MKPSQPNDPPPPPSTAPNESLEPLSDSERISALTEEVIYLREQLALCESRLALATAAVQESAEDLQEVGATFTKISSITTIGYLAQKGAMTINNEPVESKSSVPAWMWEHMAAWAKNINQQNRARRKAAGVPDPEPVTLAEPNQPEGTP